MSDAWYYRESGDSRERGPVTKSDLDYLTKQGKIRPGMEIRARFGDWSAVKASVPKQRQHSRPTPAATVHTAAKQPDSSPIPETASTSAPPPVPKTRLLEPSSHRQRNAVIAAAVGVLCLLILMLVVFQRVASTNDGQEQMTDRADEQEVTDAAEAEAVAQTEATPNASGSEHSSPSQMQKDAGDADQSDPAGDANSSSDGTQTASNSAEGQTSVATANQPVPLDRNVNQNHIISPGAEFFGLRANGTRFIFLIDGSRSMDGGGDVAARRELISSIRKMPPEMEIEVIFFTNTLTRVFGKFISLTSRDQIIRKLENIHPPAGGTPVLPSLRTALRMQPDAVFLLTDGEFDEQNVSSQVRALNLGKIPINTVALMNTSAAPVLKQVASDSGGDYKYVAR